MLVLAVLSEADVEALSREAAVAFRTVDAFRLALPRVVLTWADDRKSRNLDRTTYVTEVLRWAYENGHLETVLGCFHRRSLHPGLLRLIENLGAFRDPYLQLIKEVAEAPLLADDVLMLDRQYLRSQVIEFLRPRDGPARLLVIPTSTSPGKSYSTQLIRHVAQELELDYIAIDCLEVRDAVVTAQLLTNSFNLPDTATLDAQVRDNSRPGLNVVTWLSGKLRDAPAPVRAWIVFDHVEKATPGVKSIAETLAAAAAEGKFRTLYVTLIDSTLRPKLGAGKTMLHDTPVSSLTTTDVAAYIQKVAALRQQPISGEGALAAAQELLDGLPQPLDRIGTETLVNERLDEWLRYNGLITRPGLQ